MRDAVLDALLRDLVELDALDRELAALELLREVPRDRLAFAIGVGREQDGVGVLGGRLELGEDLLLALDDLVRLGEVVLDVDAHLLGQILDVTLGGEDLVAGAEVLLDGLRLGRRLDDDECLQQPLAPWYPKPFGRSKRRTSKSRGQLRGGSP